MRRVLLLSNEFPMNVHGVGTRQGWFWLPVWEAGCAIYWLGVRQTSMLRSYHPEHTGSHQNSEVKLDWAGLVLC
jgi:hypothetical protein